MGYVGNSPAEKYTTIDKQVITGNGTVGPYTLTHSVGNEQEIEVFVNNVRQEPGVAYTVSANQLTMGGTVAAADDFYIVFQGKAKMTATHPPTFDLNAANGTFTGDLTVDTNTLYVDSTNNRVGVGTSSPYSYGKLTVKAGNGTQLVLDNAGEQYTQMYFLNNGTDKGSIWTDNALSLFSFTARTGMGMNFYTNNTERMRINSTGNVGIGTSNTTAGKTTINLTGVAVAGDTDGATIGSSGIVNLYNSNQVTNSTVMLLGGGSDSTVGQIASGIGFTREDSGNWGTQLRFYTHTTATSDLDELKERMRIDSSGNVSIGTAATPEKLSIEAPLSTLAGLGLTYSGATKAVFSVLPSTGEVRIGGTAANYFPTFYSSGTEAMRIDSSGNLLVGTANTDPAFNNVTGQSMAPTGQLQVTRDGGTAALFNRKTSDGEIVSFRKNGATVGSIGVDNTDNLTISGNSSHCGLNFSDNDVNPYKNGAYTDGTTDLGSSSSRFKDLHLSGGVVFGTGGPSPITSNTLDDYETGTWTVQERHGQATITTNRANYTKIGRLVYASASVNISSTNPNNLNLTLPFVSSITSYYAGNGSAGYHNLNSTYADNLRPVVENGADNIMFYYGTGSLVPCNGASGTRIDFTVMYMT